MKYLPDTYDKEKITKKFKNYDEFLKCQIKYRKEFERMVWFYAKLSFVNEIVQDLNIPKMNDLEYNFYHKYSNLGSDYLYLRNNYHVENLTEMDLLAMNFEDQFDGTLDKKFFQNNFDEVLFEKSDDYYIGKDKVKAKSLVFEFAYDESKCESLEQINEIQKVIDKVFKTLEEKVKNVIGLDCSFIVYNKDTFKE